MKLPYASQPPKVATILRHIAKTFKGSNSCLADYSAHYRHKLRTFEKSPFWIEDIERLFARAFPRGNVAVLDYGCGTGASTLFILRRKLAASVVGFEPNFELVDSEILAQSGIKFVRNLESLPARAFDGIVLSHVIGHIDNLEKLREDVDRLLKPSGKLLIITPNGQFKRFALLTARRHSHHPDETIRQYFTGRSLLRLLAKFGFEGELSFHGMVPDLLRAARVSPRWRERVLVVANRHSDAKRSLTAKRGL